MTQDQGKAWNPGDPTPGEREAFSWGHGAGYEAGKAAVRAEIQAQWENVSRVFIAAEWAGKPTADARRLKRLATIQAAHEAGLHVASAPAGGPLYGGCPWCIGEGAPVIPGCYRCGHPVGMHTVAGCTQYGKASYGSGPCPCDLRDDMLLAGVPHNRNYGVPRGGDLACPGRAAAGPSRPVCGMPDWDHDAHMYGPGSTVMPHYVVPGE